MAETTNAPPQILRLKDVLARHGMCRSWTYAMIQRGAFPKPIKLGRASGWDAAEVDAWVRAQFAGAKNAVVES